LTTSLGGALRLHLHLHADEVTDKSDLKQSALVRLQNRATAPMELLSG
jgi:hypothetical protein